MDRLALSDLLACVSVAVLLMAGRVGAQTMTIDTSPAGHQQVIDGFERALPGRKARTYGGSSFISRISALPCYGWI